jgi:hypothetical protein
MTRVIKFDDPLENEGEKIKMRTKRWDLTLGLGVLLVTALACNFSASTANISSLKLSKDKGASTETGAFAAADTIYAVAVISNAPDKLKAKGRLSAVQVEGLDAGPIPGAETTLDLPGSATATFTFTPPPGGWPAGSYKVDVEMLNEGGEKKDEKSATFTVS